MARASDGSWQHALSAYTEYGWNERVTLGLDLFWNDQSSGHVLTFARVPLTTRRSNFPMALTLSLGGHHRDDWGQMYRISLSAGHGFQGRWGSGWLSGDLTYETSLAPGGPVWKFDGTLGLNREHPISPMIQLEAAKRQDQPLDYKVIPSLRFRIKQQQELVVGLEYKTAAPSELGIRIALWHRF